MKGLLLKDFYMLKTYCRTYLLIAAVFVAASLAGNDNLFFVFYPCLFCGMIPVTLLGYDERSRWLQYSMTLPYSRAQLVSAKYLMGLLAQLAMLLVTGIAQAARMCMTGTFTLESYGVLMLLLVFMAAITSSISLPFMFKLGVEKGRIAYYVAIAVLCAGSMVASGLFRADLHAEIRLGGILPLLCLAGIGVYALSWYLSIVFFQRREL